MVCVFLGQTAKVDESEMLLVTVMKKIVFRVWFLRLLVILALVVCENHTIEDNQEDVQLWYIIFEVISAYSLVGVSVSAPGTEYSLSGKFTTYGKLCVVLAFLIGKNRGLPELSDPVIDFTFPELRNALDQYDKLAKIGGAIGNDRAMSPIELKMIEENDENIENDVGNVDL